MDDWPSDVGRERKLSELRLPIAKEVGSAANACRGDIPTESLGEELADMCDINLQTACQDKHAKNLKNGTRGRIK